MLTESIIPARSARVDATTAAGIELRTFASENCGATGFSTGTAAFVPGACLPYHFHTFSEAITILEGQARILLEGRAYLLNALDCIHVPAGTAHQVENPSSHSRMMAHWAFASASPSRTLVEKSFPLDNRGFGTPAEDDPETITRFGQCPVYELSENAFFSDLFAKRFGAQGICGGYGRFHPGASLPCHIHDFDESITIVEGSAVCYVQGRSYELSGYDTAFIPKGIPHRFMNQSDAAMAMLWVYAGDEPDRILVDSGFCSGKLEWRGTGFAQIHSQ